MSNILEYKSYYAKPQMSLEDNVLYGAIEDINDLVTFEAKTIEELKVNFQEAVDDYLDMCEKVGKDPDKPLRGVFNVRVQPQLHRRLKKIATQREKPMNNIVESAIEKYLDEIQG